MEDLAMNDLDGLERALRSLPPIERELAARHLGAAGAPGFKVLVRVALDSRAPANARLTALHALPEDPGIERVLRGLLGDPSAVIRLVALHKTERAHARGLAPAVAKLTADPSIVWDLDEEHVLASVAARVLVSLRR